MPIYEIHITVILKSHQVCHLENFITNNTPLWQELQLIRPHLCHAQSLYGEVPDQPMFTCYVNDFETEVIKKLHTISNKLVSYLSEQNIINPRIRNKVELKQRDCMIDLQDKVLPHNDHPYFEFHWKVSHEAEKFGHMKFIPEFDNQHLTVDYYKKYLTPAYFKLEQECLKFGVHLSMNSDKNINLQYPIATLRLHNCSVAHALEQLVKVQNYLSTLGYLVVGTTQFEQAIFDDDIDFDKGWIFKSNPEDIIISS
jgi:hypothetical protein